MLSKIQAYIAAHGTVSMADLSLHFHTDSPALRPMLAKLSRKGRIRPLPQPEKCADCTCCDLSQLDCYEWIAQPNQSPSPVAK
ncbi:FeoC-like transcriptional regulator [Leptolyngbya sp. KIOST-1]|uniref:FeoC-like transcriptional regulator n=1 Tax=Leptolyngbya sp. KIOST-1 TaxID=1229172 RepID=UPI0005652734|nr:FeoC-like transcriptional regulator [Leptolyngbya sp. KIOST-1]